LLLSSIVTPLFWIIFPVVLSYLTIALSVEEAGQVTSPDPTGNPETEDFFVVLSALSTKTRKSSRLMLQVGSQDILVGDIILKLYN